jgi:hypothetical protein
LATLTLLAFFAGRAFFFATLFFATARLAAFACGRFFPLAFFFAMVSHLLGGESDLGESSPEKVCCHLTRGAGVEDGYCVLSLGDAE